MSEDGIERDEIPPQCQLCQPLDYRGDFINEPEGMVEVARDDGGTKIVHCCERCANELFTAGGGWTAYEDTEQSDEWPHFGTSPGLDGDSNV